MSNKHGSLLKALSFLCILSLILSIVPPVGIWQRAKADDPNVYNGGYTSYNGLSSADWAKKAGVKDPNDPNKYLDKIPVNNQTLYFNCEIYAEKGQVVYGTPDDVPQNHLVSPAGFKPAANGYFYALPHRDAQGNTYYTLAMPGTPGAVRGWFRYMGYSKSQAPFSDARFPPDYKPEVITPDKVVPLSSVPASAKDDLGLAGYNPNNVSPNDWETLWKNLFNLQEHDSGTGQTLKQLLVDSGLVSGASGLSTYVAYLGTDKNYSASARIIWKDSTGRLRYRTYTGFITQGGSPKVTTKGVDGTIVSGLSFAGSSGSSSLSGAVLQYDIKSTVKPSIDLYVDGILEDGLGANAANPWYDNNTLTRNDVKQYQTRITSITINGQPVSSSIINRWTNAIVTSKDSNTVKFRTAVEGRHFDIHTNMLKSGDNTVVVTGETQIIFDEINGKTDPLPSTNSATLTFTIKVIDLQPPTLQLSVTPAQSEVTVTTDNNGNLVYTPSSITYTVKPVKVSGMTVPAGFALKRIEFVIDKDRNRVQSATTPDVTENIPSSLANATTVTNFTVSEDFDYNTTYIQPGKTGTPAYYGKARYIVVDPNGNEHESAWSSVASTQATVTLNLPDDVPKLAAASSDKINLDSGGNPKTYTVKINATAQINQTGGKKIQKWVFTAVHKQKTSESATQTVTTTSKTANATLSVTIATSTSRTSEDFDVVATLYFTDNTSKKSNLVTVSVPVSTAGSGITLDLSADKTVLSGKPGDVVSVTITATSTVTATGQITDHRVWVRADNEQLTSPTKSGTQSTLTASRRFSYVLKEDMNGKDLIFVARSRATVGSQQLDSGQKTVKVRVVVTDEPIPENQPVPEDQPIMPVEEPQNNPPAATLQAIPNVIAQGDDAILVAAASDPDEGDEATITSITANGGNVEGFAQNKNRAQAVFWSDETGTYTAQAIAQDTKGATGAANTTITVIPAIPQPRLYTLGTLKENRKVVLDATFSYAGSKRAYILWDETQWSITPADANVTTNDIKVVESLTGSQKLNCLFKKAGTYRVTLTLTNNYGNSATGTWYITIKPDEMPVVSFTTPTKILRDPADNSQASIQITSNSYSPDNDIIVKHAWFYAYDSNNDGNFDNETWYARKADGTWQAVGDYSKVLGFDLENFNSGNDSTITFKVTNVGKYKIELWVREEFGQETIEQFVTPYDRRRNVSTSIDDDKKIVEVLNVAPYATLNSSKVEKKKILINVVTDYSDVNPLKSTLNQLKADLYPYGVEVNYTIDNSKEVVGTYTKTETTYTQVTQTVTTTLTNSTPDFPETTTVNGVVCYKSGSPQYVQTGYVDKYLGTGYQSWQYWYDNEGSMHTANYTQYYPPGTNRWELLSEQVTQAGATYYVNKVYACYNTGATYGYIQSYVGYYTILVPSTTTVTVNFEGVTLNNIKDLTENTADKYLVFVSNSAGNNFSSGFGNYYSFSGLSKEHLRYVILNNYAVYATVPSSAWDYKLPESTKQQYTIRQFVNYAPAGGKLYDVNQFATILNNDIKPKYTNPQLTPDPQYVLADEEKVVYYPYWQDYENDPIINQRWRYEHDETVFDNSQGKAEFDGIWLNAPIEVFSKPGKYTVTFQAQDNPPPGTSDFDEYKLWSKLERQMVLYVHRRPIADFTAVYNKSTGKVTITDKSYDPDHQYNRTDKGIIAWKWQYKTLDDATWTDTTLSNLQNMTLQSGKTYLIKLEVQDCDGPNGVGVWSKPKIAMIDLSVSNNPPVADFNIDSEILKGNQPTNLVDKSYDPDGDAITTWHWWIYNSDGSTNKDFGEVGNNNISTVKNYIATMLEGSYRLALQVKDSNNNYSAVASKWFKIYSQSKDTTQEAVNNPPTGTFTMTITDHRTKLKPATTYTDPDGDPKNAEQWYIKFNGQTQYFDRLPDTLESAGYIYDGTYEIGYRIQDNPTGRSTKLKPLWSNWYVQTYYISTDITIQAWTGKLKEHKPTCNEEVTTSQLLRGETVIVHAKTTGYVYKVEAFFDRVDTTVDKPQKGTKVTKYFDGWWDCDTTQWKMIYKDKTGMVVPLKVVRSGSNNTKEWVSVDITNPAERRGKIPYKNDPNKTLNPYVTALQLQFPISHYNGYTGYNRNLFTGAYKWTDYPSTAFSRSLMEQLYGRVSYLRVGDTVWIKVRAYKKNADGSSAYKEVELPVYIKGTLAFGTEILN